MVEARGNAALIALAVPLAQAEPYGDMLTVDTGHFEYWSRLAHRGVRVLREAGLPTAPVWSEYDEWPGGRVLYDCTACASAGSAWRRQRAMMRTEGTLQPCGGLPDPSPGCLHRRTSSYSTMAPAVATFREFAIPSIGMATVWSAQASTS
jgi:hypothetical protein